MKNKIWLFGLLALAVGSLACLETAGAVVPVSLGTVTASATMATPTGRMANLYMVCVDALNVRSVPAAQNGVIMWLAIGDRVRVYEVVDGWGRVSSESGDYARWVNMKYLCK